MPSNIANIRSMQKMGVLVDRDSRSPSLQFRRYNLIYGFNGSGKTTISRLFASLQTGASHPKLPQDCSFVVTLEDGAEYGVPSRPLGLEKRLLVFNCDYVEQNLRWSAGQANPVFFIGADQAEAAAELAATEAEVDRLQAAEVAVSKQADAANKRFANFKRDRAKVAARHLHLGNRKHEAPQLTKDYQEFAGTNAVMLSDDELAAAEDTLRLAEPMPSIPSLEFETASLATANQFVTQLCAQSFATVALEEAQKHPDMLLWLKEGHQFHAENHLSNCLLCRQHIPDDRMALLARAFDGKFDQYISTLTRTNQRLNDLISSLGEMERSAPDLDSVVSDLRVAFKQTRFQFRERMRAVHDHLTALQRALTEKLERPSAPADISKLAAESEVVDMAKALREAIGEMNEVIAKHNSAVSDFSARKARAETAIRSHFIAECKEEYESLLRESGSAADELSSIQQDLKERRNKARSLRQSVQAHGPAAEAINRLIASYLGHNELSIHAIEGGYEIHRHGAVIAGVPSEGEKTAIALSYFLSSVEAERRKLKDLILVIDDPISSLDTKALNFACSLLKNRLGNASQLFILTHNQQALNEFRKAWKSKARPADGKEPSATFLFIDVSMPEGERRRTSHLVDMPKLLREYDSEYHYLFSHVLRFAEAPQAYYDYGYMMPNVLRRVLDVFLAFRCPGSSGLSGQIERLCKEYPALDRDRIVALERLAQVESHSDNLDDLLAFSSMTLEESREANAALICLIESVDPQHLKALKRLCLS